MVNGAEPVPELDGNRSALKVISGSKVWSTSERSPFQSFKYLLTILAWWLRLEILLPVHSGTLLAHTTLIVIVIAKYAGTTGVNFILEILTVRWLWFRSRYRCLEIGKAENLE